VFVHADNLNYYFQKLDGYYLDFSMIFFILKRISLSFYSFIVKKWLCSLDLLIILDLSEFVSSILLGQ